MSAMNRIAFECEALNHHPEWTNIYNTLDIKLTTHDANGVTLLDFKLASIINQIVEVKEDEPEG
jgi:4a-hydroxytetrahydrobiopterin dehydratase